ncbi:peptidyl-dipeptidase Dcp [Roseivirga ehrenbergii]|uniref:Peptidase M3 n=1 Tax=Roseivirga ehrenbergii (strain DSM 102268 / JCM 13514 / KCTC 12282 / NCIMB 14502 / KMM 6017) TaxID=279360 RepID=A0A150X8G8_ROSEK|nr:M3 family metallopeptidase [Roseivirga ehrenbergii]KYG75018.1 peptidase M3 [Roseivirga ehrenbergii]TCL13629.1 peptidyl-dipeptidase Dcp [Roseivirga ehrenbergii]
MNPLIEKNNSPFQTPYFSRIKNEHYQPAIETLINQAKVGIENINKLSETPNFKNTVETLEFSGKQLDRASSIFFNLNSAETNEEMQAIAREVSPLLTEFSNDILLNEELFKKVKFVYENEDRTKLTAEQNTLLDKTYKGFVRNGALLNDDQKQKLRNIDVELSKLSLQFGDHVLAETNKYALVIDNESDLKGLPDYAIEQAAQDAIDKGHEGKWVITLDYPSYVPFMTYAANRALRKELSIAFSSKAFKGDELDNQETVKAIVKLRNERAKLLGYKTHADFVLEERMAESPKKVLDFLDEIQKHGIEAAKKDVKEVEAFAKKLDGIDKLERWDFGYYSEKLKMEKYSIDDEMLKPYFKLENVVDGVFQTAQKLYGLTFKKNDEIEVYHPDVTAYEVKNEKGEHMAIFYADFFPRPGKRAGAWMTLFAGQYKDEKGDHRPLVSNVCNFTKPGKSKPSLLTFNEVTTLFHEFGHALHGMLSNVQYESLSGPSVYWDFVELPSQILENWCYEKECLDLFAKHYETGETIPESLVEKIKESANFLEGYQTMRQLGFGKLDMAWHGQDNSSITSVSDFERDILKNTEVLAPIDGTNMSCSFSHIFQGGYSAGYYSYKWAEVLDADAFEYFKENGIFNKEIANKFKDNILSKGGSEHPMTLYKRFRGQEPDVKALLRRAGLLK